jgi:Flp pilus assembly protein TadD
VQPRATYIIYLLLALSVFLVYWRVLSYEFVVYDDYAYIADNEHVRSGLSWPNVVHAFTKTYVSSWFPVAILSHIVDAQLFGGNAGGHHATSLLLHLGNVFLIFALFTQITKAPWKSALLAALFALHPLAVEPVAWISSRKDVLSTFLFLLCLSLYIQNAKKPNPFIYAAHIVVFALGLFAKSMLVTVPFLLLLLDFWPLDRAQKGRAILFEKLPHVLLAGAFSVATFMTQNSGGAVVSMDEASMGMRIANSVTAYASYLYALIWPTGLAIIYPNPKGAIDMSSLLISALTLAVISVWVIRFGSQRKHLMVGWFWYLIALGPVCGLVQFGDHIRADRYSYLPLIGIYILLIWETEWIASRFTHAKKTCAMACPILLIILATLSYHQVGYWKDSVTLFTHAAIVTPGNAIIYNNLGASYTRVDQHQRAIVAYEKAIEANPHLIESYNNLGYSLTAVGRYGEAIDILAHVLTVDPEYGNAHLNRGIALANLDRHQEALPHFDQRIRLDPNDIHALTSRGLTQVNLGQLDAAIRDFTAVIARAPESAQAHRNLALTLQELGRSDEARAAFERANRLTPPSSSD